MANPTPTPPTGGTTVLPDQVKGLIEEILAFFKEFLKINLDLGTLAGLADPELDKLAKSHAAAVKKWLKKGSWLLHPLMGRALGAFSGRLDTVADKLTEPVKTLVRKLSDYLDSFRGELYGEETGKEFELDKEGEAALKELRKAMTPILVDVFRELAAEIMVARQSQTDPLTEVQLKKVMALARMLKILAGEDEEQTEEPKVPFRERMANAATVADETINGVLAPINQELEGAAKRAQAYNQRMAQEIERERQARAATPKRSSPAGNFLKWLFKLQH